MTASVLDEYGPWPDGPPEAFEEPAFIRGDVLTRSGLAALPRVRSLVDGLLSYPAAVVLVGSYGTGKTALVDGIAGSVATGQPWLGHPTRKRRVLSIIGEGAYGKHARVAAWEHAWNGSDPIPDEDLTFLVKPASLANGAPWQEITAYAVDGGYGLVILDTFSSLAPDADETKDAALIMRRLSDLAAAIDGTALLVHHPGWSDSSRVRGGYQFEANADEVLVLAGVADSELVSLTRKKVKDGPSGSTLWLRRRPTLDSVVMEMARVDQLGVPLRERLVAVLAGCGEVGATGPQLMSEIGIEDKGRSAFYKALGKAEDEGDVTATGQAKSKRYYLSVHAPEGRS
jgi:hypothetical protein